jgi:lipoyl(octanoyl) transferase
MHKTTYYQDLGRIDYQSAWDYQERLFEEIVALKIQNRHLAPEAQQPTPNYLLFCEHPHVYTLGKSGSMEHLLLSADALAEKHIGFYKINRGGDITYHGLGQLVVYPILDLDNFFTDIHRYLRLLEEAVIHTLAEYGIEAGRVEGLTGVWLGFREGENPRKICAMGVKSSRWVTMHGLALNINTDLAYFDYIVPCGIRDKAVTSLARELGKEVPMNEVAQKLLQHLQQLFEMQVEVQKAPLSVQA